MWKRFFRWLRDRFVAYRQRRDAGEEKILKRAEEIERLIKLRAKKRELDHLRSDESLR